METPASPLLELIRQRMPASGIGREELGRILSGGRNQTKAFRRLDRLLRGERFLPEFIRRAAEVLRIPGEQLATAWKAQQFWEDERRGALRRKALGELIRSRGPHLWGIMAPGRHPSLITVVGAEFFLLFPLPEEVTRLPHGEQMREVGERVREHFRHHRRCELAGYEYRRAPDAVFHFDLSGEYLGPLEGAPANSRTFLRVGGRLVPTPWKELTGFIES